MDHELKSYLDQQRSYLDQQFGAINRRFDDVDRRFETMRQETAERFEKVETEARHTRILIEGLRDDIQKVAEGVTNVNERLDRAIEEMEQRREADATANRMLFSHHQGRLDNHEERLSGLESAHG